MADENHALLRLRDSIQQDDEQIPEEDFEAIVTRWHAQEAVVAMESHESKEVVDPDQEVVDPHGEQRSCVESGDTDNGCTNTQNATSPRYPSSGSTAAEECAGNT